MKRKPLLAASLLFLALLIGLFIYLMESGTLSYENYSMQSNILSNISLSVNTKSKTSSSSAKTVMNLGDTTIIIGGDLDESQLADLPKPSINFVIQWRGIPITPYLDSVDENILIDLQEPSITQKWWNYAYRDVSFTVAGSSSQSFSHTAKFRNDYSRYSKSRRITINLNIDATYHFQIRGILSNRRANQVMLQEIATHLQETLEQKFVSYF